MPDEKEPHPSLRPLNPKGKGQQPEASPSPSLLNFKLAQVQA